MQLLRAKRKYLVGYRALVVETTVWNLVSLTLLLPWLVVAIQQIIEGDASISFILPAPTSTATLVSTSSLPVDLVKRGRRSRPLKLSGYPK
ncbi:hypothetical protein [Mesorhizobium sp. B4-1-1]|uniref:hypothetical protein n=1 Tax=Mesorhizobium sp. B4-1-1 TaxID=2589890 RepID=UPI001125BAC3|nr:hypothetical protein [Mesorhizobium sp. B4-1-1]TPI21093.1 hypothetical protein FJW10_10145 [Mesorhizobium sp. B4-1-1]